MTIRNNIIHILTLGSLLALFSCAPNDPLTELGEKIGDDQVPFVTVSGIQSAYEASDSIRYNVIYWSLNDDIEKLAFFQEEEVTLKGTLVVNDGAGDVEVSFDALFKKELDQLGDDIEHDPLDYETARNGYNKSMMYIIPDQYQLLSIKDAEEDSYSKVSEIAYGDQVKEIILDQLQEKGVLITWEALHFIVESADLTIESTLGLQIRVYDTKGAYNNSPLRTVKVGALAE